MTCGLVVFFTRCDNLPVQATIFPTICVRVCCWATCADPRASLIPLRRRSLGSWPQTASSPSDQRHLDLHGRRLNMPGFLGAMDKRCGRAPPFFGDSSTRTAGRWPSVTRRKEFQSCAHYHVADKRILKLDLHTTPILTKPWSSLPQYRSARVYPCVVRPRPRSAGAGSCWG